MVSSCTNVGKGVSNFYFLEKHFIRWFLIADWSNSNDNTSCPNAACKANAIANSPQSLVPCCCCTCGTWIASSSV